MTKYSFAVILLIVLLCSSCQNANTTRVSPDGVFGSPDFGEQLIALDLLLHQDCEKYKRHVLIDDPIVHISNSQYTVAESMTANRNGWTRTDNTLTQIMQKR